MFSTLHDGLLLLLDLQERHLELLEGGPPARLVGPAGGHEAVEAGRTVAGQGQPLAVLQLTDNFAVLYAVERFHAQH